MPNFLFPQSEENQAYLNQLNRGTDYGTGAIERQGDRMADSERRQGQIIGSALEKAPGQYMEGARFRSQQDNDEQFRRLREAEEGRARDRFGPELKNLQYQTDILGLNKGRMEKDDQFEYGPLSSEESARMGGAKSRKEVGWGDRRNAGLAALEGTKTSTSALKQGMERDRYALEQQRITDLAGGYGMPTAGGMSQAPQAPAAAPPQGAPLASMPRAEEHGSIVPVIQPGTEVRDESGKVLAFKAKDPASGELKFINNQPIDEHGRTLYDEYMAAQPVAAEAPRKEAPAPSAQAAPAAAQPPTEDRVMALARSANVSPERARAAIMNMDRERAAAARQLELSGELSRESLPSSAAARQGAAQLKSQINDLNQAMDDIQRYEGAASSGGGSTLASFLGKISPNDSGVVQSDSQKILRSGIADSLQRVDPQAANEVRSSSAVGSQKERMQAAAVQAVQKQLKQIQDFIDSHSTYANDPQIRELQMLRDKLAQSVGASKRNIVPPMRGSTGMQKVSFRD